MSAKEAQVPQRKRKNISAELRWQQQREKKEIRTKIVCIRSEKKVHKNKKQISEQNVECRRNECWTKRNAKVREWKRERWSERVKNSNEMNLKMFFAFGCTIKVFSTLWWYNMYMQRAGKKNFVYALSGSSDVCILYYTYKHIDRINWNL